MDPRFLDHCVQHEARLPSGNLALPILYREVEAVFAYFPVSAPRAAAWLPEGGGLRPVPLAPGRAVLAIAGFDYRDSTVGVYGEVAVGIVCSRRRLPPFVGAIVERHLPDVGVWIHHLPVTTELAREAGRTLWGYPKFIADIALRDDGTMRACHLDVGPRKILSIAVRRDGRRREETRPLRTYTVKDGKLLRTTIRAQIESVVSRGRGAARLDLGDHPIAREIADLQPAAVAVEARHVLRMQSILPAADWAMPLGAA